MISFCFLTMIIGYAYGDISCYEESQCAGDIGIDSQSRVSGLGYKSLFQSQLSTTENRYCYGALSCKETPFIDTQSLYCHGTSSCSNTAYIKATNDIYGYGANSLMNVNISYKDDNESPRIECSAAKSCAHSTISSINGLSAGGALSLFATTINIISGTFTAYFWGYYAGYQATINCEAGSVCNINCGHNGCGGLSLVCQGNAQCSISNSYTKQLNAKEILFWNSTQITTTNEDQCSKQINNKTFDNYAEHYHGKDLIYTTNVGPICCRAEEACSYSLISYDSNGASVVCSGYRSCYYTDIISNSTDLMVECSAAYACYGGSIAGNGGAVYCYGYASCADTTITKISHIYCTGAVSCSDANIASSGIDITVYLTGFYSGYRASITCNENDECTILCDARHACQDMHLCCYGTCFVECNQDTGCPIECDTNPIPNSTAYPIPNPTAYPIPNPTAYPIPNPTAYPIPNPTAYQTEPTVNSPNPTANPTINLTTKQRDNTKTITIIAFAVCAFLGAFFGTICVFLCMNKRRNAKSLNAVELAGVEGEEKNKKNGAYTIVSSQGANPNTFTIDSLQNEQGIGMESRPLTELPMSESIQMIKTYDSNNYNDNKLQIEGEYD